MKIDDFSLIGARKSKTLNFDDSMVFYRGFWDVRACILGVRDRILDAQDQSLDVRDWTDARGWIMDAGDRILMLLGLPNVGPGSSGERNT